jgi:hypothetical protein
MSAIKYTFISLGNKHTHTEEELRRTNWRTGANNRLEAEYFSKKEQR